MFDELPRQRRLRRSALVSPLMTQWEFEYVPLFLGYNGDEGWRKTMDKMARLGQEGWEPVGEVSFSYESPTSTGATRISSALTEHY